MARRAEEYLHLNIEIVNKQRSLTNLNLQNHIFNPINGSIFICQVIVVLNDLPS